MFGLNILDTAIGLVFVYLVLALTCTAINEWIAGMMGRRSNTLYEGLKTLLWDAKKPTLLADFYAHPLVQDLHVADKKPSYVEPKTFALVLLDLLVPAEPGAPRTMASVRQAVANLPPDSTTRKTLSILLDECRRQPDHPGAGHGSLVQQRDGPGLRLVQAAHANHRPDDRGPHHHRHQRRHLRDRHRPRQQLRPPRGRHRPSQDLHGNPEASPREPPNNRPSARGSPTSSKSASPWAGSPARSHPGDWWNKIAGLALTAFAVSLGAPFWFDLLNRFMNIRSAGKSPNEKPKDAETPKPA